MYIFLFNKIYNLSGIQALFFSPVNFIRIVATMTMESTDASLDRESLTCRICKSNAVLFYKDKKRPYFQCLVCQLVFVPAQFFLSPEDEKAVYDLHDNVSGDAGYEKFLSRAATPVLDYVTENEGAFQKGQVVKGLDFGCGPCPVLANMLSSSPHNIAVDPYDLYYYPQNAHFLDRKDYYFFVTATEVVEHLSDPLTVLQQLWNCLQLNGGILVIMTKRVEGTIEKFRNWHYIRDPTHITFFHAQTFKWLAEYFTAADVICTATFINADVVTLTKTKAQV